MQYIHSDQQPSFDPEIALIFPPLVETNFGCYYASTAVLAGYLDSRGTVSCQYDLNEDFAVYLMQAQRLENMGKGEFGKGLSQPVQSMAAVSARLLSRFGHQLFDAGGRHLFREENSPPAYLLNLLAKPLRLDLTIAEMAPEILFSKPQTGVMLDFLEEIRFGQNLPASVKTAGISIPVGPQLAPALILASYLKDKRPDITVILGGSSISLLSGADSEKLLLDYRSVDAMVASDGEFPLESLTCQVKNGRWQPYDVAGVSCLKDDRLVVNPPEAGPGLSRMAWSIYDPALTGRLAMPELGITQARGCYWGKCVYCDYVEIYRGNPRLRLRSPQDFVAEMEHQVAKHGINCFSVITEAIPPAFAEKISRMILKKGMKVRWHSFAMVDRRFTRELFELMVSAGCEFLVIGVETMTDRVLEIMNKKAGRQDNIDFLMQAKRAGMNIKINVIPDLPTTTYVESMESLTTFEQLEYCYDFVSCFPFEVTLSSRVGHEPERFGLKRVSQAEAGGQAQFVINHLEVEDPAMTRQEKDKIKAEYQAFAARVNSRIDSRQAGESSPPQYDSYQEGAEFHLAEQNLDLVETPNGTQCYNWITRMRFQIPGEWSPLVEKMRSRRSFSRREFVRWFSPDSAGEFFFDKMIEKGILELARPD